MFERNETERVKKAMTRNTNIHKSVEEEAKIEKNNGNE